MNSSAFASGNERMSFHNWCMSLTSRWKRSAIAFLLVHFVVDKPVDRPERMVGGICLSSENA
jgi:hypothetical protein